MKKTNIAILGSTSHIAKGLINNFLRSGEFELHLYTRSPDKTSSFLAAIGKSSDENCIIHKGYRDFTKCSHDVIINCVGVGTMNKLQGNYTQYFTVTEEYDNLAIGYLRDICPDALYVSLSSGAVYGREFSAPVEEDTINSIQANHVAKEDYYGIVRLYTEAKHRAFQNLNIVDLRIFSYFSRFIDLTDGYFITDVIDCILNKRILKTSAVNIVRDYIHPNDLFSIIKKCTSVEKTNTSFDVISAKPVEKREILDYFSMAYGLRYEMNGAVRHVSATGAKNIYCSGYNSASVIGYKPEFSSLDTIKEESRYILK